ncbi:hypothetical protein M408DRAFT_20348 [Serendipita vermifera MAFF 305830]|uniref:Homeobox domain-containing protein n=1 Tax=Serendipita vermifera MAFF 305830 TaxID=933852 RepID=A0A0C2XVY0_SERVB|nr:hypothetical protein M408DRAFT_20348 [Serendipita vermifera MAFF 305830]
MSENTCSSPYSTQIDASDAPNASFDSSTDMLSASGDHSSKDTRITRSHNALSGSNLDDISEFKRGRTKFTPSQLDALEALFATHGPHPTREQRTLVAEQIDVPPRTVQIFLQNRRQRDSKNRNAAMNAQAAKMEAKQSAITFPTVNFEFVTPQSTAVISTESRNAYQDPDVSLRHNEELRCRKKVVSSATVIAGKKHVRNARPLITRNISLDNVAEGIEGTRRSPRSKENVPLEQHSPSFVKPKALDRETTPIKQRALSYNTPPAAALWTRMISSPPTPLSPINRRKSTHLVGGGGKCANLSQALELACAKARVSDRPCGEITVSGRPKAQTLFTISRPRTASSHKRLRHEFENENDAPRKRATVAEGDQVGRPELWDSREVIEDSRTWRVRSWRAVCATSISNGDTSASEELITPDNSMTVPSSPSSIAVENVSAEVVTSPDGYAKVSTLEMDKSGLAALEANAALVLATLFTKV